MEIKYNVTGEKRKEMVAVISKNRNHYSRYVMPGYRYKIGEILVDKDGTVIIPDGTLSEDELTSLRRALAEAGFESNNEVVPTSLCISIPKAGMNDESIEILKQLVAGKEKLIKKSLGIDSVAIIVGADTIEFPWFSYLPEANKSKAATQLIAMMAALAKNAKYCRMGDYESDNEKYTFRTFLLRLGMIGAEYKDTRKTLLQNLSGNSAFRHGNKKTEAIIKEGNTDGTNAE